MRRVGFYGGAFDPPHAGHAYAVLHALQFLKLERLLVAPVYRHPDHKRIQAPYEDRCEMVRRLLEPFHGAATVSYIEQMAFQYGGSGITADTLDHMFNEYFTPFSGNVKVVLVLGSDVADRICFWEGYDRLRSMVAKDKLEVQFVDRHSHLSSTLVRDNIRAGDLGEVRWQVPASVYEYLKPEWYR